MLKVLLNPRPRIGTGRVQAPMSAPSVATLSKGPPDDDDEDEDPDFTPTYVAPNAAAVPPVRSHRHLLDAVPAS